MSRPKKEKINFFLDTFLGELVQVVTKHDGVAIEGYFLDADDENYYFGVTSKEVSIALKKEDASLFSIVPNELKEMLQSIPIPKSDKGFN